MAYIINKTNGSVITTIADGTIDLTSTSIGLIGRHYPTYGEVMAENLVKILENFSNNTAPAAPLKGQIWFDATSNSLNVNISDNPNSPQWLGITKIAVSSTEPVNTIEGSMWYDSLAKALKIRMGSTWEALKTIKYGSILPSSSESTNGDMFFNVDNNQVYAFSSASKFTGTPGWDAVGIRYASTQPSDIKDGEVWFDSSTKQLKVYAEAAGGNPAGSEILGPIFPKTIGHNLSGHFGIEISSVPVIVEMVDGNPITATSPVTLTNPGGTFGPGNAINMGVFSGTLYKGVNLTTDTTDGNPRFNGAASSIAADLAERFESDIPVEPGDLVKIGGAKDVTKTLLSLDYDVFGVVSTNPAYMMNDGLGDGEYFPFIALAGRVPVKVVGPVQKGQRLVSSNIPGVAKAISNSQIAASYVGIFGRALESSDDPGIKLISSVVGSK